MTTKFELKISNKEDRLTIAKILIDNGYTVGQIKRRRTETGKTFDYFLKLECELENINTSQ
jgi:hypothetical protein|nr:MAG TPA: CDI toxin-like protein [Caudoviricetes sp.]